MAVLLKNIKFFSYAKACLSNFVNNYWKRIAWSSPYLFFGVGFTALFLFASITLTVYLNFAAYAELDKQLKTSANHIDKQLNRIFEEITHIMVLLENQILAADSKNLNQVSSILSNVSIIRENIKCDHTSWTRLDWVSPEGFIIVNSKHGVFNEPKDITSRSYINECKLHPKTLKFSEPVIGATSGLWVLPVAYGIIDKKNVYKGALVTGLVISELNFLFKDILSDDPISYLVVDHEKRIILRSYDVSLSNQGQNLQSLINKANIANLAAQPFEYQKTTFAYSKNMLGYPFTIIIGYKKPIFQNKFNASALPRLLEIWGVGILCLILFYIFNKKIIALTRASESAKELYLRSLNQEMKAPLNSIIIHTDVLIKHIKGEIDIPVNHEQQISFLEKIQEESFNLMTLTTNILKRSYIDITQIIRHALAIQSQAASKRHINIKVVFEANLPLLYADELRLKQIVVGLLSLSINYTQVSGTITLKCFLQREQDRSFIIISIEDNGFGLSEHDIRRLSSKFEPLGDGLDLEYSSIEKLIKMHQGTCEIKKRQKQGKIITVRLPYSVTEETSEINKCSHHTNIYNLNTKKRAN